MEKEFIPYEQALALKELQFNEPCFGYYEPNGELNYIERHILKDFPYLAKNSEWQDLVAAPTFSQAFRWFREKYNLNSYIKCSCTVNEILSFDWTIHKIMRSTINENFISDYERTYEEAELACLKKLIEITKTK